MNKPRRIGRFELRRVLGKGAQATVWLAHDTRLDREVALKWLDPQAQTLDVGQWLHEARAVARLTHPNIVPVFEADEIDGHPCLVFEYVPGPTLASLLQERGPMPPVQAVAMMMGILDALAVAHAQGIVHRDLKPSNVLLGPDGRARVMDFGIAARVSDGADDRIIGTPGYLSPEAARGETPAPAMDVFAAGLLLSHMLIGSPLIEERDPRKAVRRVLDEACRLPPDLVIDDGLRAVVDRALDRDLSRRYADAAAMRHDLATWSGALQAAGDSEAAAGGTLEFLLRRMRHRSDFPALSTAVSRIQRLASSEKESVNSLADEILKDVALTKKLLRLVNSAHFSQAGSGGVSTVSRAIMLVGLSGIRNLALSLILLEHMGDKSHAQQLKEEFVRSLMAAHLAAELSVSSADAEEAFIGALFQNLGRLLTEFYFPEEASQIRALVATAATSVGASAVDEQTAAQRVLGLSFEDLGLGVARHWGMPETLRQVMRRPLGASPSTLVNRGADRNRWVVAVSNDVADVLLAHETPEASRRVEAIASRHARALGLKGTDLRDATSRSRSRLATMASAMGLDVPASSPARRLLQSSLDEVLERDTLQGHELHPTRNQSGEPGAPPGQEDRTEVMDRSELPTSREDAAEVLTAGIQDITNSLVDDNVRLNQILRMVLETMYRALGFRRVVFCLRDPKTDTLVGRFGLGEEAPEVAAAFRVPLGVKPGARPDLFTAVCIKAADTLIADVAAGSIAQRLPSWFQDKVAAPTFLMLPITIKGSTVGLIYADKAKAGTIEVDERELNLLRTLRNQAVMALRQVAG